MKILLASDHAGFELKNHLVSFLKQSAFDVEDCGPFQYNESDDYPDLIAPAAERISENWKTKKDTFAIILGGSGQGEAMVADRFPNVRTTVYYGGTPEIVALGRQHNNANVLSLGARFVTQTEAETACLSFLKTEFEGGRHERRIGEIEKLVNKNNKKEVRIGVGVLVYQKRKILLGKRIGSHDSHTWAPPGGHLDFGETLEQCAIREVFEETGILANRADFAGYTEDFFEKENKHYVTFMFQIALFDDVVPEIREPHKCLEWKFFNLDSLPEDKMVSFNNFLKKYGN